MSSSLDNSLKFWNIDSSTCINTLQINASDDKVINLKNKGIISLLQMTNDSFISVGSEDYLKLCSTDGKLKKLFYEETKITDIARLTSQSFATCTKNSIKIWNTESENSTQTIDLLSANSFLFFN
jgi:WD40 repeat protein